MVCEGDTEGAEAQGGYQEGGCRHIQGVCVYMGAHHMATRKNRNTWEILISTAAVVSISLAPQPGKKL